jgi:hypothetical protein
MSEVIELLIVARGINPSFPRHPKKNSKLVEEQRKLL